MKKYAKKTISFLFSVVFIGSLTITASASVVWDNPYQSGVTTYYRGHSNVAFVNDSVTHNTSMMKTTYNHFNNGTTTDWHVTAKNKTAQKRCMGVETRMYDRTTNSYVFAYTTSNSYDVNSSASITISSNISNSNIGSNNEFHYFSYIAGGTGTYAAIIHDVLLTESLS